MRGSKRLTFVAMAIWAAGMLISSVEPWQQINYGRAALDRLKQFGEVADSGKPGPRILLIGSSPVVLGLSAKRIAAATGVPTYNLAMPGALSFFPEYFDAALKLVRPNDIVILSNPNWLTGGRAALDEGCIQHLSLTCVMWRPRPLPNLLGFFQVVTGRRPDDVGITRNEIGDVVSVRGENTAANIPTFAFPGQFGRAVTVEFRQIIEGLRAKGACPLLTLGPMYVSGAELDRWQAEQSVADGRLAKLGLSRSALTDGAIDTDRSHFLDSYEHPSSDEMVAWSERIINRLTSESQSPCAGAFAKADRLPNHS